MVGEAGLDYIFAFGKNYRVAAVKTFLYDVSGMTNKELDKKLTAFEGEDKGCDYQRQKRNHLWSKNNSVSQEFFHNRAFQN